MFKQEKSKKLKGQRPSPAGPFPDTPTNKSVQCVEEYVQQRPDRFDEEQKMYCRGVFARMKFDSHRRMKKGEHKLAKHVLEKVGEIRMKP